MDQTRAQPTDAAVAAFLDAVAPPARRAEALRLDALFRQVTGWRPVLWGSIVGYGAYRYAYASGRKGESLATGFSPRKGDLSIYILPGLQAHGAILARLGRHRAGAACLYLRRLDDADPAVLAELIGAGLADLAATHAVDRS